MEFINPQIGRLNKRYKRFFIDIDMADGQIITAHCCNTGKMTGLLSPNALCMFSTINSKLGFQWQMVYSDNTWVGVNTIAANNLFKQWVQKSSIWIKNINTNVRGEYNLKNINGDNHRVDFLMENISVDYNLIPHHSLLKNFDNNKPTLVEVKHVQWKVEGEFLFPDTPTDRGSSQLKSLIKLTQEYNILLVFVAQRIDSNILKIARDIDPVFYNHSKDLINKGGMIMAVNCQCENNTINIHEIINYVQ